MQRPMATAATRRPTAMAVTRRVAIPMQPVAMRPAVTVLEQVQGRALVQDQVEETAAAMEAVAVAARAVVAKATALAVASL